jgi:class 3 adenylate cyclase
MTSNNVVVRSNRQIADGSGHSERRNSQSTEGSDDASSGSLSSSLRSYHSDNLRSPDRSLAKIGGKGFPPKSLPSPRPSLALSSDGSARIANIEDLKERLSNTHRKNKERRRASLASHFSGTQSSSGGDHMRSPIRLLKSSSADCFTGSDHDNQSLHEGEIFLPPMLVEADVPSTDGKPSYRESTSKSRDYNMSGTSTILFGNIVKSDREKKRKSQIKKDQIIESIVWFSFHIPRTVLEDLIAHELQTWNQNSPIPIMGKAESYVRKRSKQLKKPESSDFDNDSSDVSVSDLSDDGGAVTATTAASNVGVIRNATLATNFTRSVVRREHSGITAVNYDTIRLPKAYERESAILFVDMSGFTKLSTILDVESLSKIINSYFDLIVSEVILYGGDILKFAGDAFFAEWRVPDDSDTNSENEKTSNPLSDLNASLVSINDFNLYDTNILPVTRCVMMAAKCASSIVKKFSDYHVTSGDGQVNSAAMLNVHCGVGVGQVVGLHVRDCKDGEDEDAEEQRREFLLLGSPIDQVRYFIHDSMFDLIHFSNQPFLNRYRRLPMQPSRERHLHLRKLC